MIRFNCPNCGKQITTKDTTAGIRGKCPGCGGAVTVPVSDDDMLAALGDYESPKPIEAVIAEVVPAKNVQGLFNKTPPVVEKPTLQDTTPADVVRSALRIIGSSELPEDARIKLQPAENVHHFAYIDSRGGGCSNPSTATQWLMVTDRRILFEGSVNQGTGNFVHQSGSIPIAKVSYVGVTTSQQAQGCASVAVTNLVINSSGGKILLAIPTKQQANSAQWVIDAIISRTT